MRCCNELAQLQTCNFESLNSPLDDLYNALTTEGFEAEVMTKLDDLVIDSPVG
jgi:hypothetical protein